VLDSGLDPDACARAADLLERIGRPEDVAPLVAYLDRVLPLARTTDHGRYRGVAFSRPQPVFNVDAARALNGFAARMPEPPPDPHHAGSILLYLSWMAAPGHARPSDADERCLAWLEHHAPYVQKAALESLTPAGLERAIDRYYALAAAGDVGVRTAAFVTFLPLADRLKDNVAVGTVRSAGDTSLMSAAAKMATAQGLREDLAEAWIEQLDTQDSGVISRALHGLADLTLVLETPRASGGGGPSATQGAALAAVWKEFVENHRADIRAGVLRSLADPGLDPALFGNRLSFQRADGTWWPPKPERARNR
jgi:hypothetical protein